jgi:uncharacterized protein (TIGR01777 family)
MRIFVTGGSGFVGRYLIPRLLETGHELRLLLRAPARRHLPPSPGAELVEGNPMAPGPWWGRLADCDAAINLIGEPIDGYWSAQKRARIRSSRLLPTALLVEHIPKDRPFTLISASAVGYYGNAGERILDEQGPAGRDYLATVARDWEAAALKASEPGARVIITRFGLVLGPGGALTEMIKGLSGIKNGVLGNGRQWLSWIHQEDLAQGMLRLLENTTARGAFNFGSPNPVRQGEFARTLGRLMGRTRGFPTPAKALRLALGGFADALLASQRMRPKALLETGFEFHYPKLEAALREILARMRHS